MPSFTGMRPTAITSINPVGTERAAPLSLHDWHRPCGPSLLESHGHLLPLHPASSPGTARQLSSLSPQSGKPGFSIRDSRKQSEPYLLRHQATCYQWAIRGWATPPSTLPIETQKQISVCAILSLFHVHQVARHCPQKCQQGVSPPVYVSSPSLALP